MRRRATLLVSMAAAFAAVAVALTACAPTTQAAGPPIAVLNGPSQGRVEGAAQLMERAIAQRAALHFHFVNDAAMRFAEGHNDLFYDRALTSAGRVARSYGAPYAVLVGASTLDRKVTVSKDKSSRSVVVTVQMQAVVVDSATDSAVARIHSRTLESTRVEPTDTPLPPLQKDPTVLEFRDHAIPRMAPAVLGALRQALAARTNGPQQAATAASGSAPSNGTQRK